MPGQGKTGRGAGPTGTGRTGGGSGQRGPGRRRGMNTSGLCVCPVCGQKVEHQRGQPCLEQKCPGCGANMTPGP